MTYNRKPGAWRLCANGCGTIIGNHNKSGLCAKCAQKTEKSGKEQEKARIEASQAKPKKFFCQECGAELLDRKRKARPGKKLLCPNCISVLKDEKKYYSQPEEQKESREEENCKEKSLAQRCPECKEFDLLECISLKDNKTKICRACYNKQVKAEKDKEWDKNHPDQIQELPFGTMQKVIGTLDPSIEFCDPNKLRCSKCGRPVFRDDPVPVGTKLFCEKCRKKILRHGSKEKTLPKAEEKKEVKLKKHSKICKCGAKLGNANKSGLCQKCEQEAIAKKAKFCKCGAKLGNANKSGLCAKCAKDVKVNKSQDSSSDQWQAEYCQCGAKIPKNNKTGKCTECCRKDRMARRKEKSQAAKKEREEVNAEIVIRCEVCGEILPRKYKRKIKGVPFLCRKHYIEWKRDQKDPERIKKRGGIIVKCSCGKEVIRKKIFPGQEILCDECKKIRKAELKKGYLEKKRKPAVCEKCGTPLPKRKRRGINMTLLCHKCEKESRKERCSFCKEIRTVSTRLENGDPVCGVCSNKLKQRLSINPIPERYCACGAKLGHRNKSGICQKCADKEKEKNKDKTSKEISERVIKSENKSVQKIVQKAQEVPKTKELSRAEFVERALGNGAKPDASPEGIVDGETGIVIKAKKKRVSKSDSPEDDTSQVVYTPEQIREKMQKKSLMHGDPEGVHRTKRMEKCPGGCHTFSYLDYASPVTGEWICLECFERQTRACQNESDPEKRKQLFPFLKGPMIVK